MGEWVKVPTLTFGFAKWNCFPATHPFINLFTRFVMCRKTGIQAEEKTNQLKELLYLVGDVDLPQIHRTIHELISASLVSESAENWAENVRQDIAFFVWYVPKVFEQLELFINQYEELQQ